MCFQFAVLNLDKEGGKMDKLVGVSFRGISMRKTDGDDNLEFHLASGRNLATQYSALPGGPGGVC